jgi:hypothetical protein
MLVAELDHGSDTATAMAKASATRANCWAGPESAVDADLTG